MIAFFYDSYGIILKFLIPGIFLGMVYDVFRLFRIARNDHRYRLGTAIKNHYFSKASPPVHSGNKKRKITLPEDLLVFTEDLIFFLIVSITEILTIYYVNGGEIRTYCLLFSVIGFFTYQKTVGALFIFLSRKILYLLRRCLYLFTCLILTPSFFVWKLLKKILSHKKHKKMGK